MSASILTLTYREAWERMGISEATFYRLKKAGAFDRLRVLSLPHRFSIAKVDAFIEGQRTSSRPWRAA